MVDPESHLPIRVYSPVPELAHPWRILRVMWSDLLLSRHIAWRLFLRDFSAQYRVSFLGYAWAFLPPLLNSFIFVFLNSQGILKAGAVAVPYPLFALTGTVLWQLFADALMMPLTVLQQSKSMLARLNFPGVRDSCRTDGATRPDRHPSDSTRWHDDPLRDCTDMAPASRPFCPLFPLPDGALRGVACRAGRNPLRRRRQDSLDGAAILDAPDPRCLSGQIPRDRGGDLRVESRLPLIISARSLLAGSAPEHLLPCIVVTAVAAVFLMLGWVGFRIGMPHLVSRMG